jgi:prepilin-type N-terminal cleavage/methylation domain-containing protein/prepilin-type processing-associated H-X9-DG protein
MHRSCVWHGSRANQASAARRGFSLVELLVVIGITGTLLGMALPAVHRAREASRRAACGNKLLQCALGTLAYESARRTFPPGCDLRPTFPDLPDGTQHAWSTFILPYVEENDIASRIDLRKVWDAPGGNDVASDSPVATYVCPSGIVSSFGKADYGGISGAWIMMEGVPFYGEDGLSNGTLVSVDSDVKPVRAATVSDGLSATLLIGESVDRCDAEDAVDPRSKCGRWSWINCFAQAVGFVNARGSDIHSNHPGGAQVGFADGHVVFVNDSMDPAVLSAICTRNGGEAVASAASLQ